MGQLLYQISDHLGTLLSFLFRSSSASINSSTVLLTSVDISYVSLGFRDIHQLVSGHMEDVNTFS